MDNKSVASTQANVPTPQPGAVFQTPNKHGLEVGPKRSQLYRELMGVLSLSAYDGSNSVSRKQMFGSHISQRLTIAGGNARRIQTGMEREFGKYTFATRMPVDATILKIIDRYHTSNDTINSIAHNPEKLIIYENAHTKEVGCLSLVDHFTHHPYLGFKYKRRSAAMAKLYPGQSIAEGTILQDTPAISEDGDYHYGRECNVAYMAHPAVSEDGILISRDVLPLFAIKTYETRVVEFGKNEIPINLYGDATRHKSFPDIGERIAPHGILMALRTFDDNLSPVEQSVNSMQKVNPVFDNKTYVAGPGGRVVDIRIQHDPNSVLPVTPAQISSQALVYDNARRRYYKEILEFRNQLKRRSGGLVVSPEFHRLIAEAISVINPSGARVPGEKTERVSKLYKGTPLDDFRIEFVIEYDVIPDIGFKLTDCHGGKGVICKIAEPHEMPVDAAGNRADIVMSPEARISRMNLGGALEPFVNASARDFVNEMRKAFGPEIVQASERNLVQAQGLLANHPALDQYWPKLMRFYEITAPQHTLDPFVSGDYERRGGTREYHMANVLREGIYLYSPPENSVWPPGMVRALETEFPSVYGPVTYVGNSGIRRTTKYPVEIGSMYIMLLEKIADDGAAVSSGKWQNFGVLGQINTSDKHATPIREQATRAWGEAEIRIATANVGGDFSAEILDRNNNILSHREVLRSIYATATPTRIECAVDRRKIPRGQARPLQLVKHLAMCGGLRFEYAPHRRDVGTSLVDEDWQKYKE